MGAERNELQASEHPANGDAEPAAGVGVSGVRLESERDTTPAPAATSGDEGGDDDPAPMSKRPTGRPRYDVAAHAFETSLSLHQSAPRLPHDGAVPVRTRTVAPSDLDLRAAFVLLHVDGQATVAEIAALTAIPLDGVLDAFVTLGSLGLVSFAAVRKPSPAR
ncbi:MAG: hypothetical protein JWP97_5523 [Labilithrix sp.]|nr:hypothetical protein [Labilithrix sp.]